MFDYDMARPIPKLTPLWRNFRLIGLRPYWIRYDRTRRGWHIVCEHNLALSSAETVALQAVCGSDLKREALNLMRAVSMARYAVTLYWNKRWNILFNGKVE
jgi:hypothetical protein